MESPDKCISPSAGSWQSVPHDALAGVVNINSISRNDVGSLRLVCTSWRSAVDSTLTSLEPNYCSMSQLESMLQKFTLLNHLDVRRFDARMDDPRWLLQQSNEAFKPCVTALAAMPSLTSLTISSEYAREMGRKIFACWYSACRFRTTELPQELSRLDPAVVQRFEHFINLPSWLGQLAGVRELQVHPREDDLCLSAQSLHWTLLAFVPDSLTNLKVLSLNGTSLGTLPGSVGSLPQLERLSLSNASIATISPNVSKLINLQHLDLSNNKLVKAPRELSPLQQLRVLDLSHNTIASGSSDLSRLRGLEWLSLANNQLNSVPHFIGHLSHLTYLNLSHNWLAGQLFTADVCGLRTLHTLEGINISDKTNPLDIPPDAATLTSLAKLDISSNFLSNAKCLNFLPSIPAAHKRLPYLPQ